MNEMLKTINGYVSAVSGVLYYPILIVLLLAAGFYFTFTTKFVQFRLLVESVRLVLEKPDKEGSVSSFKALMVSTASRVGTGNIIGVSSAICLGGVGSVFWMWLIAIIGSASAFVESTLAQIYKRRDKEGHSYGGPAYYIETALKNRTIGVIFAVMLILTYGAGFNMLASFNLQDSFRVYSFYNPSLTPWIIGGVTALIVGYVIMGGGKRIMDITGVLVPIMGVLYVVVSLFVMVVNYNLVPGMFAAIFKDAFDFQAIFGGIAGSSMMYGIKRGLFSNEAGVGSAPNAAAAADVSHPVKQGLVQMLSVFLDTIVICSATAFMCLASGVVPTEELAGAPYVQSSVSTVLGETVGPIFITVAMVLFAVSTLVGNFFYVDNCLAFINKKAPSDQFMMAFRIVAAVIIFLGAGLSMELAWNIADVMMALMVIINLPACFILGNIVVKACKDYETQKRAGKNPVFLAKSIGMDDSRLDYWK